MDTVKWLIYKMTHPFIKRYWRLFKPKTRGARGLIIHEEQILLVKNLNAIYWSLPGGKIDKEETPEACLFRELKEELSLSISKTDYRLGEYLSEQEGKRDTIYIFVISHVPLTFQKQWELQEARWFPLSHLPKETSPATARRIQEFQQGKKDLISTW